MPPALRMCSGHCRQYNTRVTTVLVRVLLAPILIAGASLAGRRWGNSISGWIVGLPLTSGPIALVLALQYGSAFAAQAAFGTMAGALTQGAFSLAYGYTARYAKWPFALGAGCAAFAVATAAFHSLAPAPVFAYGIVVSGLAAVICLLRRREGSAPHSRSTALRFDLPIRMALATAWVFLLTGIAPLLGAEMAGLLSPFPMYGAILTVFAHRQHGSAAAVEVLRGMLYGLFGFGTFFLLEGLLIERTGIAVAFAAAITSALVLQLAALKLLQRK